MLDDLEDNKEKTELKGAVEKKKREERRVEIILHNDGLRVQSNWWRPKMDKKENGVKKRVRPLSTVGGGGGFRNT